MTNNNRFGNTAANLGAGFTYELYWNNGKMSNRGIPWVRLTESRSSEYTVRNVDPTKEYFFKIRASSACGFGVFSQILSISYLTVPAQMVPVKVTQQSCDVFISWVAPENGGTAISSYKLEIQDSVSSRWIRLFNCGRINTGGFGNRNGLSCTVSMKTLSA